MVDGTGIGELLSKSPELLKEIYGDLAKPGVQQLGKAIGGIIGLGNTALIPLHIANEKGRIYLESNFEKLRIESAKIPNNESIEVTPEIGVPVLEKLTYVNNEEISRLYINLLAKASSKPHVDQAHPSFHKIIGSMSPDEAVFLKTINIGVDIPFINISLKLNNSDSYNVLEELLIDEKFKEKITYPENTPAYISNLASLGILEISKSTWLQATDIHYKPLWQKYQKRHEPHAKRLNRELTHQKGVISVTPFGKLFTKACLIELRQP